MEAKEDFSGKYLTSNFVIKFLVESFFKSIKNIVSKIEVSSVLEVGCGEGFSTQRLKSFFQNKKFEASDLNEGLINKARKKNLEVKISQESIYNLKRKSDSFDLIIVLEVLEHLKEPEKALKELERVTSKYCIVSVPEEPLWRILNFCRLKYIKNFGNTPGHLQHWSKKQFLNLIEKYFKVKKVKTPLPWIVVLAEKKNGKA